ncbi:MAG: hypothetical protein OEW24_04680 [Chloroflexota bacterium]|nr:hypothetical protein [Chloroflexota bacterium]
MNRETRIGVGLIVALGAFVAFMLTVGSLGDPNVEFGLLPVSVVLNDAQPANRHGDTELRISGWFAELDGDCTGDDGGADARVAWLQRDCPLRVLLVEQPPDDVTQADLARMGLRLAAPSGRPFPSRAEPGGPNLRLQQLVFIGHFDDAAADRCVPERTERCRNTFVVSNYDGLVR